MVARGKNGQTGEWKFEVDKERIEPPLLPGEDWKVSCVSPKLLVSDMGRFRMVPVRGGEHGFPITARVRYGVDYAMVGCDGKEYRFHRVVYCTFHGEDYESFPFLIDHENRDKSNNFLNNLKKATRLENAENVNRKPASETHEATNKPIEGRDASDPDSEWEWLRGLRTAARNLAERTGIRFTAGNTSLSATRGYNHRGWVLRYV